MEHRRGIVNVCGAASAAGLSLILLWCTLMGHTPGFLLSSLGLAEWANARTFWLTGILVLAAVLAAGMTGCGAGFEGSGSKDAASAEQLAMRLDDPWAQEVQADQGAKAEGELADGVYTGTGKGMEGLVTVKLLVQDNRISCLETAQEGESQSRGGYEAIRDGRFAAMIEAAQGAGIDAISGATITTAGVRQAVEDALSQAEAAAAKQEQGGFR